MKIENQLKEMFDLFTMVEIKGAPISVSSFRPRIVEISREILHSFGLPDNKGFDIIFLEMAKYSTLTDNLVKVTIQKLNDCANAHLSGRADDYTHYLPYETGLTISDFSYVRSDTYPRPIISTEVIGYVQNRLSGIVSREELLDIETGFAHIWNKYAEQFKRSEEIQHAVEHFLLSKEWVYDKELVGRVVNLMLDYLQEIGQWKQHTKEPDESGKGKEIVVYFSFLLIERAIDFMNRLSDCLMKNHIRYHFLPETKDIWCRDYMPVRVKDNTFVQFIYDPGYLKKDLKHCKTDPWEVTMNLPIEVRRSHLVVDGGNVVRKGTTVIMTDKIFSENTSYNTNKQLLLQKISEELEVEKVVIVPKEPWDLYGHSDGMVSFISDDTIIINDYLEKDGYSMTFIKNFKKSLQAQGILIAGTLPYRFFPRNETNKKAKPPHSCIDTDPAIGCYINYLELKNLIIFPQFGIDEDEQALKKIQDYFPNKKIIPLNCSEIAKEGGVLNCISWEC